MKGKERTRYKAFRKLVNRCLFHTLQRYVKDNISYNNITAKAGRSSLAHGLHIWVRDRQRWMIRHRQPSLSWKEWPKKYGRNVFSLLTMTAPMAVPL